MTTIRVTQDHIRRGQYASASWCPVALAIKEQLGVDYVAVSPTKIYFGLKVVSTPHLAAVFICRFDSEIDYPLAQPFEFELPL